MPLTQVPVNMADISLTQLLGVKNMLINGDFRVWQKGTDLNPATVGNQITSADRWTNQYVDFSPRIRRVEDTINGEIVDSYEITKLSGSFGSAETTQKVETTVAKYLRGQTVTFSFWIKKIGNTLGSHSFDCWIGDSDTVDDTGWTNPRTFDRGRFTRPAGMTGTSVFTATNAWQQVKITRTLNSDTNTIYCTIYTINTPTNEGIRIAKCQLEVGSEITPFERRPYAMELSMCQRYFEVVNSGEIPEAATYYASWKYLNPIRFCATKRATPTITVTSQNGWPNGSGGTYGIDANIQYVAFQQQSGNAVNNNLHRYDFFANAEF